MGLLQIYQRIGQPTTWLITKWKATQVDYLPKINKWLVVTLKDKPANQKPWLKISGRFFIDIFCRFPFKMRPGFPLTICYLCVFFSMGSDVEKDFRELMDFSRLWEDAVGASW